ncbi:MAG TPA: histidine phosphatase family protein [Patescibacteria group bacterium]|nr:histidine phosphatase family protein [Patescibacteria group bacterium]
MQVIFEAHSTTLDNEANHASGWNDVELSQTGIEQAKELSKRYNLADFDAVFTSDLQRAYETARIAFPKIDSKKLFIDWRLRECNYGDLEQSPKDELDNRKLDYVTKPFPGGESYADAMQRMKSFIDDLREMPYKNVIIFGSRATHYGLDVWIDGKSIEDCLNHKFSWQPGWHYELQ